MNPETSSIQKIHGLLVNFSNAMLVTHSGGSLRARPMAIARLEADCTVWFITSENTAKAHEIESDTHVHIVCQEDRTAYLSISATASLVKDSAKVREIWKESFKVWFPTGPTAPEIVLIEVKPIEAEFWDNHGFNGIKYLLQTAKAYATGRKPEMDEGDQHGFVKL